MDVNFAIVFDESHSAKLVHEMADALAGRADHLRQCLLVDPGNDLLLSCFLPLIGKQQKSARQPLLGRIEQMINQIVVQTHVLSQKVRHEKVAKSMVVVHGADDAGLFQAAP